MEHGLTTEAIMQNELQRVFMAITGYEPGATYSNVEDEYYAGLNTAKEKLTQIKDYAENVCSCWLSSTECQQVYDAIESEKTGSNDWYVSFASLAEF